MIFVLRFGNNAWAAIVWLAIPTETKYTCYSDALRDTTLSIVESRVFVGFGDILSLLASATGRSQGPHEVSLQKVIFMHGLGSLGEIQII